MYYSAVGILALFVLCIENMDVMLNRNGAFDNPSWRVYRRLLGAVLLYYITDIAWGLLYHRKLARLLFADTSVYFIVMARYKKDPNVAQVFRRADKSMYEDKMVLKSYLRSKSSSSESESI